MGVPSLADAARVARAAITGRTWIYFIQSGHDRGPIKIGSAVNPAQRLRTLQQGNPVPLKLIAVYRAFSIEERQIHKDLAVHRIHGEWFWPATSVVDLAATLNDPDSLLDFAERLQ